MKIEIDKIARTIIDTQYQTAHAHLIAGMYTKHLDPLVTEDDILAAAVNITKQK